MDDRGPHCTRFVRVLISHIYVANAKSNRKACMDMYQRVIIIIIIFFFTLLEGHVYLTAI